MLKTNKLFCSLCLLCVCVYDGERSALFLACVLYTPNGLFLFHRAHNNQHLCYAIHQTKRSKDFNANNERKYEEFEISAPGCLVFGLLFFLFCYYAHNQQMNIIDLDVLDWIECDLFG